MSGKLVKTVFQTGPDDSLAAEDVYEGGGSPENTYDDKRGAAIDTMDAVSGEAASSSSSTPFAAATTASAAATSYSSSESNSRMAGSNNSVVGFLNNLSQAAKDLFNLLPSQSNLTAGGTPVTGNVAISDVRAVVNIINNLSNNNFTRELVDTGAQTQLISNAITTASNAGINGGFQALEKNPSLDRTVLVDSAISSITSTVADGNLGVILDVSQTSLMSDIITRKPGIVQTIFSSPAITNIPLKDQNTIYNVLKTSLDAADPGWNTMELKDVKITDLKDIKISDQMQKLIRYNIFELPLTVELGDDTDHNPAIDVELSSSGDSDIIEAYQRSVDMYAGSQFPIVSVRDNLDAEFQYLGITSNSSISRIQPI